MKESATPNLDRFSGLAEIYDAHRPRPPVVLLDMLTQLAQIERPQMVVDLGCGTGLSTFVWIGRAETVVGVEPNADMRAIAETRRATWSGNEHISFREATAAQTGLPTACADIVTCAQAFHWMEPESTLAEVARILRPGGVFAAYDYLYPPTIQWEVEAAWRNLFAQIKTFTKTFDQPYQRQRWAKEEHLSRLAASGHFRYVKQIWLHSLEKGNAERLIGLALSQSHAGALLKQGFSEADLGFKALRETAERALGDQHRPWYFSYAVRIGIK